MSEQPGKLALPSHPDNALFSVAHANRNRTHRIKRFIDWLGAKSWMSADLAAYRDYLLKERGLAPSSVANHLASVRARYKDLMESNELRDHLFSQTPDDAPFERRKAAVDEVMLRLHNATTPKKAQVKVVRVQDHADSEHLRLTVGQSLTLLEQPAAKHGGANLKARRDTAMIALLLCTGIREGELCNVLVDDLRQTFKGEAALRIQVGKGAKQRMIPYGGLAWCLDFVDDWRSAAGIAEGYVFRGFKRDMKGVRSTRMDESTVQRVLAEYQIEIDGRLTAVQPHDCRRTYARLLYDAGVGVDAIKSNLGHDSVATTWLYIGAGNVKDRTPPNVYGSA